MGFGHAGSLDVSEEDLVIIGRFIHRCGIFEAAIDEFIKHYELEQELDQRNNKSRKSLDDKVTVLKKFCYRAEKGDLDEKEFSRSKKIHKNIRKYKRQNGVKDLRNTIAHNPILVSVMGAWQPGPGYKKKYPQKTRTSSGERVEVLETWSFAEIDTLSDELLEILTDIGYFPKNPL